MALTVLDVRGPFKGPSGYEHHVREFVRELHRQGVAIQLADLPEWGSARLPASCQWKVIENTALDSLCQRSVRIEGPAAQSVLGRRFEVTTGTIRQAPGR